LKPWVFRLLADALLILTRLLKAAQNREKQKSECGTEGCAKSRVPAEMNEELAKQ